MSQEIKDGPHHYAPYIVLGFFGYGLGLRFVGIEGAIIGVLLGLAIAFWLTSPHRRKVEGNDR
jgi:hypothetical protein